MIHNMSHKNDSKSSSTIPVRHVHSKSPTVFLQKALSWQGDFPLHSLISMQDPSSCIENPSGHPQWYSPSSFLHSAPPNG